MAVITLHIGCMLFLSYFVLKIFIFYLLFLRNDYREMNQSNPKMIIGQDDSNYPGMAFYKNVFTNVLGFDNSRMQKIIVTLDSELFFS